MRFDLKIPCKNCPFADRPTRIKFACRERAAEIEETAYREGFPCHLSAESRPLGDGPEGFFEGPNSQHCAGAIGMYLNETGEGWPGVGNEEPPGDYEAAQRVAFESVEAFLEANT